MADALAYFGDTSTSETETFIRNFDRWFDCMNVRSLSEAKAKRKPDLEPNTSPDDSRLKVNGVVTHRPYDHHKSSTFLFVCCCCCLGGEREVASELAQPLGAYSTPRLDTCLPSPP